MSDLNEWRRYEEKVRRMECYAVMTALPFDRAAISVRFTISTAGKQSSYKKVTLLTDEYIDRKLKVSISNLGFTATFTHSRNTTRTLSPLI